MKTANTYTEIATQIRDHLMADSRNAYAYDGHSKNVWAAEKALGTVLGGERLVHAWIEPTADQELDREGTIRLITPGHLMTAAYDTNARSIARVEPLLCTGIEIETVWARSAEDEYNWLSRAFVTLKRVAGDIDFEVRNNSHADDRVKYFLGAVDALKAGMVGGAVPSTV